MTAHEQIYRRVMRRETHVSRSGSALVVAAIASVVFIGILVVGIWSLVDPVVSTAIVSVFANGQDPMIWSGASVAIGIVIIVVALILLFLAILPGRRARRARMTDRAALVLDDGVIADAVAEAIARRGGMSRNQVAVTVRRREVVINITPTSGVAVDRDRARAAADDALRAMGFPASSKVIVNEGGVIV